MLASTFEGLLSKKVFPVERFQYTPEDHEFLVAWQGITEVIGEDSTIDVCTGALAHLIKPTAPNLALALEGKQSAPPSLVSDENIHTVQDHWTRIEEVVLQRLAESGLGQTDIDIRIYNLHTAALSSSLGLDREIHTGDIHDSGLQAVA